MPPQPTLRDVRLSATAARMSAFLCIDLVAPVKIDGAPGAAFEACVEETGRVLERGALGEGQLHFVLVRLAGADDPGVFPHRNPQHRVRRFSPLTCSTTSGSASLMRPRTRASVSPRQSLSAAILASIS